jgi:hypothetical protein
MKLHEILSAQVEELKRQDEENMREMQAIINRCNNLLTELQQLDE